MRILKEYKLCDSFKGDSLAVVLPLPQEAKVIEAYCKGSDLFVLAAIDPSVSNLIKREFILLKAGARLPKDDDLAKTSLIGLVQMKGLNPIVVLECPTE